MQVDLFKLLAAAEEIWPLWEQFDAMSEADKRNLVKVAPLVGKATRALLNAGVTLEGVATLAESPQLGSLLQFLSRRR